MQDVALLAVHIVQKRDARAAVRVVLDGRNLGGHAVLVALEVDDAVTALVAAALMARGDAAVVVAPRLVRLRSEQRLLRLVRRDLGEVRDRLEAPAGAGRLVLFDSHDSLFSPGNLCSHASPYTKDSFCISVEPDCRGRQGRLAGATPSFHASGCIHTPADANEDYIRPAPWKQATDSHERRAHNLHTSRREAGGGRRGGGRREAGGGRREAGGGRREAGGGRREAGGGRREAGGGRREAGGGRREAGGGRREAGGPCRPNGCRDLPSTPYAYLFETKTPDETGKSAMRARDP